MTNLCFTHCQFAIGRAPASHKFSSSLHRRSLPARPSSIRPVTAQQSGSDDSIATEFARFINERDVSGVPSSQDLPGRPSHLLSPTTAVAAIITALQRNDWPDTDSGIESAFFFTKPYREGDLPSPGAPLRVRQWTAVENYVDLAEFTQQLHTAPYDVFIECEEWNRSSPLVFPSSRTESRAVQAVQLKSRGQSYNFSFCLERQDTGSMKGCWLVAGVRVGDYSV